MSLFSNKVCYIPSDASIDYCIKSLEIRNKFLAGCVRIRECLDVKGSSSFSKITVRCNALIKGNLVVCGTATINDELTVNANTTINGNLAVEGTGTFDGELTVNDNVTINGNLGVTGTGTFDGELIVNDNATINGNLGVTGTGTFDGELLVNDNTTINGNTEIDGNLCVSGTGAFGGELTVHDDLQVDGSINADNGIYSKNFLLLPPGSIFPYAGSSAPGGYLICDGSAVSRTTYSDLFSVISTTYGIGDGSTTFNVPNLVGRMILGVSGSHALASVGGSETHTLTVLEMPSHNHTGTTDSAGSHTHTINDPGHVHAQLNAIDDNNGSNIPGQAPVGDANTNYVTGYPTESATTGITINASGVHSHTFTTNSTGGGNAFSIINPFISLNYIIKI